MMAMSDRLLEDVFDFVNRQDGEPNRLSVARAAKLAAEYRALQLKRERMQKAIDKRAAERRALRTATAGGQGDQRIHRPGDNGSELGVSSSALPLPGQGETE